MTYRLVDRLLRWAAVLLAVLAVLRTIVPTQVSFLGLSASCGSVLAWLVSGNVPAPSGGTSAMCVQPLHSAGSEAAVLLVMAALVWLGSTLALHRAIEELPGSHSTSRKRADHDHDAGDL
jgi:hypothetical protein